MAFIVKTFVRSSQQAGFKVCDALSSFWRVEDQETRSVTIALALVVQSNPSAWDNWQITVRLRGKETGLMETILRFASISLSKIETDLLGSWRPCQCVLPTVKTHTLE